jgi:hypothetical protein
MAHPAAVCHSKFESLKYCEAFSSALRSCTVAVYEICMVVITRHTRRQLPSQCYLYNLRKYIHNIRRACCSTFLFWKAEIVATIFGMQ